MNYTCSELETFWLYNGVQPECPGHEYNCEYFLRCINIYLLALPKISDHWLIDIFYDYFQQALIVILVVEEGLVSSCS